MENLNLDLGIREYRLTDTGVLRFNPSDPNVYKRFLDAEAQIRAVEQNAANQAKSADANGENAGERAIRIMFEADDNIKKILNNIYGHRNDFHTILDGVNLMAVGTNGNRIINNLLDVLTPIMEEGAKKFADGEVSAAKLNRQQRRALQ